MVSSRSVKKKFTWFIRCSSDLTRFFFLCSDTLYLYKSLFQNIYFHYLFLWTYIVQSFISLKYIYQNVSKLSDISRYIYLYIILIVVFTETNKENGVTYLLSILTKINARSSYECILWKKPQVTPLCFIIFLGGFVLNLLHLTEIKYMFYILLLFWLLCWDW